MLSRLVALLALATPFAAMPLTAEDPAEGCLVHDPLTYECLEWSDGADDGDFDERDLEVTPTIEVNGVPCYYVGVAIQPEPYDSFWNGHRDADGNPTGIALNCAYWVQGMEYRWMYWAPAPPGGFTPPDPAALAERAIDQLGMEPPEIGIVPDDVPGSIGIIGLPSWGWTANPAEATLGPLTTEVAEGPYRVSVSAQVDKLIWDWGDGTLTECTPPGTPYEDRFGVTDSPDCGHTYTKQGDPYTVTLTAVWRITWEGLGASGELEHELTDTTQIVMGEWQVINR
jgi:hypothetical protein